MRLVRFPGWQQTAAGGSGYYQYLGSDLNINSGDHISIEIEWKGQSIKGESIVPH